jgi:predicted nuclease with TOPRIM domain
MAEQRGEVTNVLIFEALKTLQKSMNDLREDAREIKGRLGILETQYASISTRLDRMDDRVARIERRLDLVEA